MPNLTRRMLSHDNATMSDKVADFFTKFLSLFNSFQRPGITGRHEEPVSPNEREFQHFYHCSVTMVIAMGRVCPLCMKLAHNIHTKIICYDFC